MRRTLWWVAFVAFVVALTIIANLPAHTAGELGR
jgi:hypothetical protein